jgi:hypothetical protein
MSFDFLNAAQILEMNIFPEVRENKSVLHVYLQLVFDFEEKINIKFLVASVTKHLLILIILLKAATEFYSVISLFFSFSNVLVYVISGFRTIFRIIAGFRNNFVVMGGYLKTGINLLMRTSVSVFRITVVSIFIKAAETLFF